MPRASATSGGAKLSCPQPCGGTLAVDGRIKCRRCKTEYSIEWFVAHRLMCEGVPWIQLQDRIADEVPKGVDTPYHAEIRKLFGERFIGIPELWQHLYPYAEKLEGESLLSLLGVPYTRETLEQAAADKRTYLVLMIEDRDWAAKARYRYDESFCSCHNNMFFQSSMSKISISSGWRLLRLEIRDASYDALDRGERYASVAETVYFIGSVTQHRRVLQYAPRMIVCVGDEIRFDRPLLGFRDIPVVAACPKNNKKWHVIPSYATESLRNGFCPYLLVRRPDILAKQEVLAWVNVSFLGRS